VNYYLFPRLATAAAIAVLVGTAAAQVPQTNTLPSNATTPSNQVTSPSTRQAPGPSSETNRLPANKGTTSPQSGDNAAPSEKMTGESSTSGTTDLDKAASPSTGRKADAAVPGTSSTTGGDPSMNAESQPTPQNPDTKAPTGSPDSSAAAPKGVSPASPRDQGTKPPQPDKPLTPYALPDKPGDSKSDESKQGDSKSDESATAKPQPPSDAAPDSRSGSQKSKPRDLIKISENKTGENAASGAPQTSSKKHAATSSKKHAAHAQAQKMPAASSTDNSYRAALRQCVQNQDQARRDSCLDNAIEQFGKNG